MTTATTAGTAPGKLLTGFTLNNVHFRNRILRSSVGGRMSNYDGSVTDVWKNFEKRFADGGVAGIISTTFHVNKERLSPLQYPSIADEYYVPYLAKYIAAIRKDRPDCRYLLQIGDPGYTTYTSLVPEAKDAMTSSPGFDFAFGYNNRRRAMADGEIRKAIADFVDAAERVRRVGADGLEVTATKGYLIHQFLNPGINRRDDDWGGDADRRFRFLGEVVSGIRQRIGRDFLFGVRLSARDFNASPLLLSLARLPPALAREARHGNDLPQMLDYAKRLKALGVDFLHVVSGYGFPNPRDVPGPFPFDEIRMFFNSTRHLSGKAAVRATLCNALPAPFGRWLFNLGWNKPPGVNLPFAQRFQAEVGLPVIANGGFQFRAEIEDALAGCEFVSMARALIANPTLVTDFEAGLAGPSGRPCVHCNQCVGRTVTSPLGCWHRDRFESTEAMMQQIMAWNHPDPA